MATKRGTIYSNIIGQWQLATNVYEDDYDVASNTSPVTLKLYLRRAYTYYGENGGTYSGQIRFDGNWKANYSGTIPYPTGIGTDWFYLTEVNTTAYHNSDGSYSPNISISAWGDFAPFNTNPIYDGSITFSTIPRATPAPNISCDVESSVPFTLSPYADFYQSVQIKFGDYEAYLLPSGKTSGFESKQPKSVTEWTFSADKDYYRRFDKKSLIGSLIVRTYNKSILHQSYTLIGTSTGQITINANANLCSPVITGTVVDTLDKTELGLTKNDLIKYVSKPELTATIQITAPNDNNATLTFLQVAGKTISDLTTRVFPIENPLNKSFLVKAINSRDFSTETVISASGEFIDYTLPTITITSAKRTEPTTGDATIEYKGDWFNNKFSENVSNTLTLTWKYKEKDQTAYTNGGTLTPTIKDNTFSGTINVDGLFNYKKQYDIIVIVTDKLSSTQSVAQILRGFPIFWWSENFVDILGELRINGNNPFLYSEDETVIGKWYDGKPLYQKVIIHDSGCSATVNNRHAHGIENVDTIFIKHAFIQSTQAAKLTYMLPVTQYGSNTAHDELSVCIDTTYYEFLVQTGWGGENWHIFMIVNYTKVTDSVANLMIEDETKPTKTI